MANINYKCDSCGHHFKGDEYTLDCPVCGNSTISVAKSGDSSGGALGFFKKNKLISIIGIVVILIIVILALSKTGDKEENDKSQTSVTEELEQQAISFKVYDDYIQIKCKTLGTKRRKLKYENNQKLFALAQFKAIQNNEPVEIVEDKIYPCKNGNILIKWNPIKLIKKPKGNKKQIDFTFAEGIAANNMANCKPLLEVTVQQLDSCRISILTNYDSLYPDEAIYVSISGKEGIYLNKRIWNCKKGKKVIIDTINVWAYSEKSLDTVAALQNGEEYLEQGCHFVDPTKVIKIINKYAGNPGNLNYLISLKRNLPSNVKIYYENKYYPSGMSEVENILKMENDNYGTHFKAKITTDKKTHAVTKINFVKR